MSWHYKTLESYRTLLLVSCKTLVVFALCFSFFSANAQDWRTVSDGEFEVLTLARADEQHLSEVFAILREAKQDLRVKHGLRLPTDVQLYIHPTLASYTETTAVPWFVSAIANREDTRIDVQRIQVLLERDSLTKTLRHELYHLAQEEGLERWQAEGRAMVFAGEVPKVRPLKDTNAEDLNRMLEAFEDREGLARATATAYQWVLLEK